MNDNEKSTMEYSSSVMGSDTFGDSCISAISGNRPESQKSLRLRSIDLYGGFRAVYDLYCARLEEHFEHNPTVEVPKLRRFYPLNSLFFSLTEGVYPYRSPKIGQNSLEKGDFSTVSRETPPVFGILGRRDIPKTVESIFQPPEGVYTPIHDLEFVVFGEKMRGAWMISPHEQLRFASDVSTMQRLEEQVTDYGIWTNEMMALIRAFNILEFSPEPRILLQRVDSGGFNGYFLFVLGRMPEKLPVTEGIHIKKFRREEHPTTLIFPIIEDTGVDALTELFKAGRPFPKEALEGLV